MVYEPAEARNGQRIPLGDLYRDFQRFLSQTPPGASGVSVAEQYS